MDILITQESGRVPVTVIHLNGRLDASNYEQFETRARELVNSGAHYLLIDLHEVPYMSSAGARAINNIFNMLETTVADKQAIREGVRTGKYRSPHLKLLNPTPRVLEVLKMIGLDMFLDIHHDLKHAVASY